MSGKTSFEQLCTGKTGYSCDEDCMVRLTNKETFNDLVFKITTKCEANLIFLPSPTCTVSHFTVDIIADYTHASVASVWRACETEGYAGLSVIAALDHENVPQASLPTYKFPQFVNSIIHSIESHFMFQKYNQSFSVDALNLFRGREAVEGALSRMKNCCIVMAWKLHRKPLEDVLSRSPLSQLNPSPLRKATPTDSNSQSTLPNSKSAVSQTTSNKRRRTLMSEEISSPSRRRRVSDGEPLTKPPCDDSTDEDSEISFRQKPEDIIPKVKYLKGMTTEKEEQPAEAAPEPKETEAINPSDKTLEAEKPQLTKKGGRKSMGRKSLVPEWPEEEKEDILSFFDNLNPSKSETTRVALTCKFTQMQFGRELPSKLLYQWIQKKGRTVNRTFTQFEIPEAEQNKAMLDLYKELNPENSETSRVAFICKFVNIQFGLSYTSKEFYDLLNGKTKKTAKRR